MSDGFPTRIQLTCNSYVSSKEKKPEICIKNCKDVQPWLGEGKQCFAKNFQNCFGIHFITNWA